MNDVDNPRAAIDSLLEQPELIGKLTVWPLTVARMSLLELVESPFLNPDRKFTIGNMTESAFIMCATPEELRGFTSRNVDRLVEKAYMWADGIDINAIPDVIKETMDRIQTLFKVAPTTGSQQDTASPNA